MENSTGSHPLHHEFESHDFLHQDLLPHLNRDMRFVGMFYIIYGAFVCLTIIGALLGVPMIIMGLRLRDAAKGLEAYNLQQNQKALHYAFAKQGSFFSIQKIIIIVTIVFMVLYFIGIFFFLSSGALDGMFGADEYETFRQAPQQLLFAVS